MSYDWQQKGCPKAMVGRRFASMEGLLSFAVLLAIAGCSREGGVEIRTAADLGGRHVAHMSSGFHKRELAALQPDVVFDPYSEYSFAFESLRNGKIDAISIGKTYADIWMAKFAGEFRIAFEACRVSRREPTSRQISLVLGGL